MARKYRSWCGSVFSDFWQGFMLGLGLGAMLGVFALAIVSMATDKKDRAP
jgi:hypothetical protein